MTKSLLLFFAVFFYTFIIKGQSNLNLIPNLSANAMVDLLVGQGVTYTNPTLNCPSLASGRFSNGLASGLLIDSGIVLTSGTLKSTLLANGINLPASNFASTNSNTNNGDANLANAAGVSNSGNFGLHDLCKLEFDFVPSSDTVKFNYRFGSEEYPQFNCSDFNDIFAFFINGPGYPIPTNVAIIPNTSIPVSINSINSGAGLNSFCTNLGPGSPFTGLYVNNANSSQIVYNGLTVKMQAKFVVQPCSTYHMKFAIADLFDNLFDSGVFLEANSFASPIASISGATSTYSNTSGNPFAIEGCNSSTVTFKRPIAYPYSQVINLTPGGSAINGIDYTSLPTAVTIPANDTIVNLNISALQDNLSEGTETLILKINGIACSNIITDSIVINILERGNFSISKNDTICIGQQANISVISVVPNPLFTYNWSPSLNLNNNNSANVTATPTTTTTYTVSVGTPGCPNIDSMVTITVDSIPNLNTFATSINCINNTATITATSTIGIKPMVFSLLPSNINQTGSPSIFSNLISGNYTIVAITASGCSASNILNISAPTQLLWQIVNTVPTTCNLNNGTISSSATGGTGIINYNLIPNNLSNSTGVFNNLSNGFYTIVASDANNCSISTVINVSNTTSIVLSNLISSNLTCNSIATGTISTSSVGGTGVINYNLQPTNVTNTTGVFSNLVANIYTVKATDANGCSVTTQIIVTQPSQLVFNTPTQINVSCFGGNNGSITQTALGGTGIINYNLQPTNATNTTGVFSNLVANIYTVKATDANGCSVTTQIIVTQPSQLVFNTPTQINVSCFGGNNGSITQTALGGTGIVSYNIQPTNQTNATGIFNNLAANNYTITATDSNNCSMTTQLTITAPTQLQITNIANTVPSCVPGNDGSITITATGGTPIYQYNNGGVNQTSNLVTNVGAGAYIITVTDSKGCTSTGTTALVTPNQPNIISVQKTSATCIPGNDATVTITASNGTAPYSYSSNGIIFQNSNVLTSLVNTTYTIIVKDINGCTGSSVITINAGILPTISGLTTSNILCNGSATGSIQTQISSGVGILTYQLLPNNVTNTTGVFSNLPASSYTITVTDVNGCSSVSSTTISQPQALQFTNVSFSGTICNGNSNGTINAPTVGGTGNITYSILPSANFVPPSSFNNLIGNITYTVTATDANNCSISTTIFISQPNAITINSFVVKNISCFNLNNGKLTVTASGGVGALTFSISPNVQINSTGIFNGLSAGNYTATVIDANGCSVTSTFNILNPAPIKLDTIFSSNVICNNQSNGKITISCSGGTGSLSYNLQPTNTTITTGIFNNLPANTYTIVCTDINACTYSTSVIINTPLPLIFDSIKTTNITCAGNANGSISAFASGGNGTIYTYSITPLNASNSTGLFNNLLANTYTVSATDSKGCSITQTRIITELLPLNFTLDSIKNIKCFGDNNGAIYCHASSGSPYYIYKLMPINITDSFGVFTNLPANTYSVVVTDYNGCSASINNITITQPNPLVINTFSKKDVLCNGTNTGEIKLIVTGGTGVINYTLSTNPTLSTSNGLFTNLYAGNYVVTAIDANGCSLSTALVLNQNPAIEFSEITAANPLCHGDANGSIKVKAIGGTGTLTYQINNGPSLTGGTYLGLTGGNYLITVRDGNNCKKDTLISIIEPASIYYSSLEITPVYCFGENNGSVKVTASGGTGNYTYYIRPGLYINQNGAFYNLQLGIYTLTVIDENQCNFDTTFTITPSLNPLKTAMTKQDLGCYGKGVEGWADANVSGGEPPYTFVWSTKPAQTTEKAENLLYGYYFVDIVDAQGCNIKDTVYINPGTCCEEVFMPNAFTPNGDGINDVFKVTTSAGIELIQFAIFDRWGNRIWNTYDFRRGWDGSYKGAQESINTFHYIFHYKCLTDGNTYMRKGDVNLIR
jgi:gliding motility-associated-like protein